MSYSPVTTVLARAASHNFTDLATVKVELSIKSNETSNDAWLNQAIMQVSGSIIRHCKRVFAPETVQDVIDIDQDPYPYQTPGGFAKLLLSRWPVIALASVVQTLAANTYQTLVRDVDFRLDPNTGQLLRLNPFTGVVTTWEAIPVTVVYTAGYGVLVTESGTVPASAPYTVTVSQAAAFSCDVSVAYASGALLTRVTGTPAQGQYSVDAGVYTFAAADAGHALSLSYATLAVPAGLLEITLGLITARYAAKGRDPNLMQEDTPGIGAKRYWIGGSPNQKGAFAPDIDAALDEYRVPTIA